MSPGVPASGLPVHLDLHLGPMPWDGPPVARDLTRVLVPPSLRSGGAATGVGTASDHSDAPEVFAWGVFGLVPPYGTIRLGIAPYPGLLRGPFPRIVQVLPDFACGTIPDRPREPRGRLAVPRHLAGAAAAAAGLTAAAAGVDRPRGTWASGAAGSGRAAQERSCALEGRTERERREERGGTRAAEDRASTSTGHTH